jgi:hypothetical protein
VGDIEIGDRVEGSDEAGSRIFSRVYFIHDHVDIAPIVQLKHEAGCLLRAWTLGFLRPPPLSFDALG